MKLSSAKTKEPEQVAATHDEGTAKLVMEQLLKMNEELLKNLNAELLKMNQAMNKVVSQFCPEGEAAAADVGQIVAEAKEDAKDHGQAEENKEYPEELMVVVNDFPEVRILEKVYCTNSEVTMAGENGNIPKTGCQRKAVVAGRDAKGEQEMRFKNLDADSDFVHPSWTSLLCATSSSSTQPGLLTSKQVPLDYFPSPFLAEKATEQGRAVPGRQEFPANKFMAHRKFVRDFHGISPSGGNYDCRGCFLSEFDAPSRELWEEQLEASCFLGTTFHSSDLPSFRWCDCRTAYFFNISTFVQTSWFSVLAYTPEPEEYALSVQITKTDFEKSVWYLPQLRSIFFNECNISNSHFAGLQKRILSEEALADLPEKERRIFRGLEPKAEIRDCVFWKVRFNGTMFRCMDLTHVVFHNCEFKGALFERCNFSEVRFAGCDVSELWFGITETKGLAELAFKEKPGKPSFFRAAVEGSLALIRGSIDDLDDEDDGNGDDEKGKEDDDGEDDIADESGCEACDPFPSSSKSCARVQVIDANQKEVEEDLQKICKLAWTAPEAEVQECLGDMYTKYEARAIKAVTDKFHADIIAHLTQKPPRADPQSKEKMLCLLSATKKQLDYVNTRAEEASICAGSAASGALLGNSRRMLADCVITMKRLANGKIKDAEKHIKNTADSSVAKFLTDRLLAQQTGFNLDGWVDIFRHILFTTMHELARAENELQRLEVDIQKLLDPVLPDTWSEVASTWLIFYKNCHTLKTQRAQTVAIAVWDDQQVRKDVEFAKVMLENSWQGQAETAPETLKRLKHLQETVKANQNSYLVAIQRERRAIDKIGRYKNMMYTGIANLLLSAMITLGNYIVQKDRREEL